MSVEIDATGGSFDARAAKAGPLGPMMLTHFHFQREGYKSLTLTFESHGPLTEDEVDRLYALLGKGFTVDGLERAVAEASDG